MTQIVTRLVSAVGRAAAEALIVFVRAYQMLISPILGARCRYAPSCSQYAIEALRVHGVLRGGVLAAWRVLRCNPFSKSGYDPVPPRKGATGV